MSGIRAVSVESEIANRSRGMSGMSGMSSIFSKNSERTAHDTNSDQSAVVLADVAPAYRSYRSTAHNSGIARGFASGVTAQVPLVAAARHRSESPAFVALNAAIAAAYHRIVAKRGAR